MDAYSILKKRDEECESFVESGGDRALFWAGKMSRLASSLHKGYATQLSHYVELLERVAWRYDREIIFNRAEAKEQK